MRYTVSKPDQVSGARESMQRTMAADEDGMIPDSIRGVILAVPCKRMLRAIYGSAWRAIFAWAWQEIRNDASWAWYRGRGRGLSNEGGAGRTSAVKPLAFTRRHGIIKKRVAPAPFIGSFVVRGLGNRASKTIR